MTWLLVLPGLNSLAIEYAGKTSPCLPQRNILTSWWEIIKNELFPKINLEGKCLTELFCLLQASCSTNCMDKYMKMSQRISQRFQEVQMASNESLLAKQGIVG